MSEPSWRSMSAAELLAAAKRAGLQVGVDGDRLVVRGPRTAEQLGRQLLQRKQQVLGELRSPSRPTARGAMAPPLAVASVRQAAVQATGNVDAEGEGEAATRWDVRAAAVVSAVDAMVEAALASRHVSGERARQNVLRNECGIVRRLAREGDPFLWEWPEALRVLLARWATWDGARRS